MSAAAPSFGASSGNKKAVHVKWAGKTIALGTFPASEADEKCARAKALTRAWRSTMRPKPSRDWVMMELERLGVRVVSGRLGRKAGDEEDEKKSPGSGIGSGWGNDNDIGNLMAGTRRGSMGLSSMMNDGRRGSLGSLVGLDSGDPSSMGRSLGNGFDLGDVQRRSSGLGGIGGLASAGLGGMGMSVNPNQHYEMLKLHHMNLLNEIQETTLMMNLYQQQQLQQQQQQLQQQAHAEGLGSDPLSLSMLQSQQNGGMDQMFGGGQMGQMSHQQRASLGLGASTMGTSNLMSSFGSPPGALIQSHHMSMQQQPSITKEPDVAPSSRVQYEGATRTKKNKPEFEASEKSKESAGTNSKNTKNTKKRPGEESAEASAKKLKSEDELTKDKPDPVKKEQEANDKDPEAAEI